MTEPKDNSRIITSIRGFRFSPDVAVKFLIAASLVALLALMFPRGEAIELDYKVGGIWARKDLIAPFSFPIYRDDADYASEVTTIRTKVIPVFERLDSELEEQPGNLARLFSLLQNGVSQRKIHGGSPLEPTLSPSIDSSALRILALEYDLRLSEKEWELLEALTIDGRLEVMQRILTRTMQTCLQAGFMDIDRDSLHGPEVAIRRGTFEEVVPGSRFYDRGDVAELCLRTLDITFGGNNDTAALGQKIALRVVKPNLVFNRPATEAAVDAAIAAIPRTIGFVQENERVVSKHERITGETKLKLESLRRARAERGPESDAPLQFIGILIHVSIVVMLYGIYIYLFRQRIYANNLRLTLIALLILIQGCFAYITRELNVNAPIEYLIFVPTASMLLTITFDSRVGFYGTVIIAFLVAGIRGNDYSIALASLVAGALAVYTVRDMKNRTQIFRSLGFIFLGYALTIIALALERFDSPGTIVEQLVFALTNAIISPVLTYGLLIFIERVFKVTTDLTLIELAQFNHPLLRQLGERAPGTYHHSMTMASLAESAAVAVKANEVLARVGAYFHDIGKISKPTYFVENQKGTRNRHDKLSPRMSSLIIAAHVKDGVALAQEHKLPEEVVNFIPQHHGTTRIEYFYNKALKLAGSSPDETKVDEIKEQDYRYPGPKPQTKETGILMLADAIEASARTLEDPSPQKLEALIDDLIKKRFEEGELDECPLTLKDLTKIKAAFLGVLVGIHHTRVKYPADEEKEKPAPVDKTAGGSKL